MTLGHYMRSMRQLTNQWNPTNFRDERRQRLYLKDIDCPPEWHDSLRKFMPPNLFYLNENVTDRGVQDPDNGRDGDIFRTHAQSAPAGDLMSCLPEEMRAQNLMCYVGHEGTYTAAHREMCASLGQNVMVEASGSENGEKPGSSIWFMTETKDREVVREYFLSMLGHDIEIEKHFAQINAWKKATFPVYVVDQKPGDFILIPPLAAHQVWNRGTRTMKVAWNRTTVETLELAMKEALPKARLVCRDEQYKNKAIIYYALRKYAAELETAGDGEVGLLGLDAGLIRSSPRTQQLLADFKRLFRMFSDILTDEMFATKEKEPEFIPFDSCITCSYCRSNIFNRFLTCKHCVRPLINGDEDTYDVCMECYAMGRSCMCVSGLQWCEQWNWSELVDNYEHWRMMIIRNDGFVDVDSSPMPLEVARSRRGKRSLAQVCQVGLKRRPFKDITKPAPEKAQSESEPEVDDEGRVKKKKRKRKQKKGDLQRCHVCCHKDYAYKIHMCSNPGCYEGYCYGVLYRAYDMMPQVVQEDEHWQCPKCLGICNCGGCRRAGTTNPYTPKNTSLGHDTRSVADDRSVEMLVDFRIHNLSWLKAAGEESRSNNSKRMQRLREQADVAKSQEQASQAAADETAQAATNGYESGNAPPPTTNGHAHETNGVDMGPATNGHPDGNVQNGDAEMLAGPMPPPDHPVAPPQASLREEQYADPTAYPDPSMSLPQHLIGMGYYEQDDSPDKILFDPYETPTAESMVLDEPDVPEYLKKSIRVAKRKARQANDDDPDFYISRRSEKKRQKKDHSHEDIELDPALFSTPGSRPEAAEAPAVEGEGEEAGGRDQAGEAEDAGPSIALRRARPRYSYAETEEIDSLSDDPEDILPHWSSGKPRLGIPKERAETGSEEAGIPAPKKRGRPPRKSGSSLFSAPAESPAPQPKRRGRPPKSRLSNVVSVEDVRPAAEVEEPAAEPAEEEYGTLDDELQMIAQDLEKELTGEGDGKGARRRGRGRPRRSAPVYREVDLSDEEKTPEPKKRGPGRPRRSAPAQPEEAFSDGGEEPAEPKPKRGPGRPRRSVPAQKNPSDEEPEETPEPKKRGPGRPRRSAPALAQKSPSDEEEPEETPEPKKRGPGRPRRSAPESLNRDFKPTPSRTSTPRGGAKRGRGRPRRSEARLPSPSPPPSDTPGKSLKMMSMAERMRLRGKRIRITSRKPGDAARSKSKSASPAVGESINVAPAQEKVRGRPELRDDDFAGGSEEDESMAEDGSITVGRFPSPQRFEGRTVLKMGDVLSEAEEEEESSGGSDDETPTRVGQGRGMAGRGRAGIRGRGRGRGRPRGRARAG